MRAFRSLDPARLHGRELHRLVDATNAAEETRWRRARALGILGTVLLHLVLVLSFRDTAVPIRETSAAAGPPRGDLRPSGGGSGMTMIDVRLEVPPETPVEEVVEVPEPVVEPVEVLVPEEVVEPTPVPTPDPPVAVAPQPSAPGTGGAGTGGQAGTSTGEATGSGEGAGGGGDGDGGASRIIPPTPRGLFIPPSGPPSSARGKEITVWVYVSEAGRVERNSVRLEPPTSDNRYNQRLIQSVAEWVFDPARQDGRAVPVWYPFQIIL